MAAQIGLMIEGQYGLNWERWQRLVQTAEEDGYQCLFRSDHFTEANGDNLDALELWLSLTYAAMVTRRIEFGSLVTPVTFRHPTLTARMAAQIDDLSGGRLVLGMGTGWQEREHQMFGIPFHDFPTRFDMFTEALAITRQLFDSDTPTSYEGQHFALHEAVLLPRPQRAGGPPILIGGQGPKRTLPLVAQYADEWNAVFTDHATYRQRTEQLNALLAQHGRQPGDVKRSLMTRVLYAQNDLTLRERLNGQSADDLIARGLIVGTAGAVIEQLEAWAALGVERFMLQWLEVDDLAGIEAMAREVLPHFHR